MSERPERLTLDPFSTSLREWGNSRKKIEYSKIDDINNKLQILDKDYERLQFLEKKYQNIVYGIENIEL